MTNKEAKDVLQEQIDRYGQEYDAEGIEALEIAIKVLEQTSCKSDARRWKRRYLDLKQRIFKMEERTSWIPVSEKLPEPLTAVLLTVRYKSSGQWTYQIGYWEDALEKWEKWLEIGTLDDEFEILAWMELPEGYEEGNHE